MRETMTEHTEAESPANDVRRRFPMHVTPVVVTLQYATYEAMVQRIAELEAAAAAGREVTEADEPVSKSYTLSNAECAVIEAAQSYEKWMGKWHDYTVSCGDKPAKQQRALINAVRALAAERGREGNAMDRYIASEFEGIASDVRELKKRLARDGGEP